MRKDRGICVWNRDDVCINLKNRGREGLHNREFKQQRRQQQTERSLENKHLGNGHHFVIIASSSYPANALIEAPVEVKIENETFTVVCSRCR